MIDAMTWQALGLTLSVGGLLASSLLWRHRGAATGMRAVAWSLLPAAAGLTGTLRLLDDIATSISAWAVHLVFSTVVWIGVALAGVSVVLFVLSGVLRGRRDEAAGGDAPRVTGERSRPPAAPPTRRDPGRTGGATRAGTAGGAGADHGGDGDDMEDVEAILRRHGIS